MIIHVVYRPTTKDYPGKWVHRARAIVAPGLDLPSDDCDLADSLDEIRQTIPPGLVRMDRDPNDDPVIEEVWL